MTAEITAVPKGKWADVGDGLRLHYHEAGEGKPIVFVHGSGPGATGWSNFRTNYPYFAEHGYRVIVPDMIGFGFSSNDPDLPYSWELVVGTLKRLCDTLGLEQVTLIGNSMGGAACIQLALDYPDLVERLVLMAPGGLESKETYMGMKGIRTMLKIMFSGEGITRESMRSIFKLQLYDESQVTDEIIEERFQVYQIQPKALLGKIRVPQLDERLSEITCPVLGMWGVNDLFCPVSGADKVVTQCADSRMVTFNGCGHWVMVEKNELFNRLTVDFLERG